MVSCIQGMGQVLWQTKQPLSAVSVQLVKCIENRRIKVTKVGSENFLMEDSAVLNQWSE